MIIVEQELGVSEGKDFILEVDYQELKDACWDENAQFHYKIAVSDLTVITRTQQIIWEDQLRQTARHVGVEQNHLFIRNVFRNEPEHDETPFIVRFKTLLEPDNLCQYLWEAEFRLLQEEYGRRHCFPIGHESEFDSGPITLQILWNDAYIDVLNSYESPKNLFLGTTPLI